AASLDEVPDALPAHPAIRAVPRPVDDDRLALDVRERHGAPEARVVALIAVVPHHEHRALGDRVGTVGIERRVDGAVVRVRIGHGLAVDEELAVAQLDGLALGGDHALDEVLAAILGPDEHDDVAALGLAQPRELAQGALRERNLEPRAVDELVDEDVIADLEGRQHGARRDLERLHHERAQRERKQERRAERLDVLAPRGLPARRSAGRRRGYRRLALRLHARGPYQPDILDDAALNRHP